MKKLFSILLVLIIFINSIVPSYAFAATAPEEPPEMPDWWREKYGDKQIEHEDFKNKEIKTIKPPKKIGNPTPAGLVAALVVDYFISENDILSEYYENVMEQIDRFDKSAAKYLSEEFGINGWGDVFEKVTDGLVHLKDIVIEALNNLFSGSNIESDDFDRKHILELLDMHIYSEFEYWMNLLDYEIWYVYRIYYTAPPDDSKVYMNIQYIPIEPKYTNWEIDAYNIYAFRTLRISNERYMRFTYAPYTPKLRYTVDAEDYSAFVEAMNEVKEYYDSEYEKDSNYLITREEFGEKVAETDEEFGEYFLNFEIKNLGYLPNPYGSRLSNPNNIEDFGEYETGIIEIDNEKYHIINVPNPNHTPELEPTHPEYVPTHYPIIRPIIPVPNSPDVDSPNHPAHPNNPYSPNNPNPAEVPEIPLIPDITPSPQPSPEPTPEPSPEPSPDPSPEPSPEPSNPVPSPPGDPNFDEGKGCGELNLDLKSIDLFTTKFPFSIPWDVFRALEAAFGKMGAEEPKFVLSFISDNTVLELPDFIKEWVPLVRTIILFLFDVSIIYALYRWLGGAS